MAMAVSPVTPLALIDEVYTSEAATNFHNRGIAWLLYSYGTMYSDPMDACDVYTKQCSVAITAKDLATMGGNAGCGRGQPDHQATRRSPLPMYRTS